jgi:ADP-heptose:LPS heptosyltransferase
MAEPRFLVSRTDRAGDLILTLPLFRELRRSFADAHIIAHVRSYTAPLLKLCPEVDEIIIDDDYPAGLLSSPLRQAFQKLAVDHCFMVHPTGRAILAAWRAGIGRRTGRASNIWQLLLNDRRVQKRSRNEKHEFCYNLDLLTGTVADISYSPYLFRLTDVQKTAGTATIADLGLHRPIIIHPGHGGSAHNISTKRYAELAEMLLKHDLPVLISLGPGEEKLKSHFEPLKCDKLNFLCNIPDLAVLAEAFSACAAFVGGSTGPLHLAAALQLPTVAFFPPVAAMTPARWGPVGNRSLVLKPDLGYCNGRCDNCANKGCMAGIDLEPAFEWLLKELKA